MPYSLDYYEPKFMTQPDCKQMLSIAVRDNRLFEHAAAYLRDAHFEALEVPELASVWNAVLHFRQEFGALPPNYRQLRHKLEQVTGLVLTDLHDLPEETIAFTAEDIVGNECAPQPVTEQERRLCYSQLRLFLQKAIPKCCQEELCQGIRDNLEIMEQYTCEINAVETIGRLADEDLDDFSVDMLLRNQVRTSSTNIPWLDDMIGGHAHGCLHLLAGAIGSGKSTLVAQIAAKHAHMLHLSHASPSHKSPGIVVIVTYEDSSAKMRTRILAVITGIPRRLLEYEPSTLDQEQRQKIEAANTWLRQRIRIVDFASNQYKALASSMGRGVRTMVLGLHSEECPVRLLLIDHASKMAHRYLTANPNQNRSDSAYVLLDSIPPDLRQLAQELNIPVWLMHQLGSDAGKKSACEAPNLYDFKGNRSFGEAADIAIGLSQPSKHSPKRYGVCALMKARDGMMTQDICVELDGNTVCKSQQVYLGRHGKGKQEKYQFMLSQDTPLPPENEWNSDAHNRRIGNLENMLADLNSGPGGARGSSSQSVPCSDGTPGSAESKTKWVTFPIGALNGEFRRTNDMIIQLPKKKYAVLGESQTCAADTKDEKRTTKKPSKDDADTEKSRRDTTRQRAAASRNTKKLERAPQ